MAMALYQRQGLRRLAADGQPLWRMDAERFRFLATLDSAPAPLRRVWAMAVCQGALFAGTLPSGRVCAMEAGTVVATWDHAFPRAGATWPPVRVARRPCGSTWTAWRSPRRAPPAPRNSAT